MLIIEIALGIVVAVVILYYLPTILMIGLVLLGLAIALAVIGGLVALFYTYPQALVVLVVIVVGSVLFAVLEWDAKRTKRLDDEKAKRLGKSVVPKNNHTQPPTLNDLGLDKKTSSRLAQADREEVGYGSAGVSAREQSNPSVLSHSITQTIGFIAKYKQRFTFGAAAFVILGTLGTWYYVEPGLAPYLIGIYGCTAFLILLFVLYCRTF